MLQNAFFFYELAVFWSAKKTMQRHFFCTLHPLSMVIFATATVLAFVLLRDSRFNFHCYTQREAMPTQKSARKCTATSIHSSKLASLNHPIGARVYNTKLQYNTTLLFLCKEICLLACHLHKTFNTFKF